MKGQITVKASDASKTRVIQLVGQGKIGNAMNKLEFQLKCNDSPQEFALTIPNPTGYNIRFACTSDVDGLQALPFVDVKANSSSDYKIKLKGLRRGLSKNKRLVFTGIYCNNDDTSFSTLPEHHGIIRLWYSLNIETLPGDVLDTINLACPVQHEDSKVLQLPKKGVKYNAILQTPVDQPNYFRINSSVVQNEITVCFSPQMPRDSGSRLILTPVDDNHGGEVWFTVLGKVLDPTPKLINDIYSPIGESVQKLINISNPTDREMKVKIVLKSQNDHGFNAYQIGCKNEELIVAKNTSVDIPVIFKPTDTGNSKDSGHRATLIVDTNGLLGVLLFDLVGCGLEPVRQKPVCVYAKAAISTPAVITFQNPTRFSVNCTINLDQKRINPNSSEFMLLAVNKEATLKPGELVDVPFCFIQSEDNTVDNSHIGLLSIDVRKESGDLWNENDEYSSSLTWKYPVVGFLDSDIGKMLNFNVPCGSAYECFLAVRPNLDRMVPTAENHNSGSSHNSETSGNSIATVPRISSSNNQIITEDFIVQRIIPTKVFDFIKDADMSEVSYRMQFDSKFNNTTDVQVSLLGAANLGHQEEVSRTEIPSIIFGFKFLPKFPMVGSASLLVVHKEEHAFDIPMSIEARDDNIDVIIDLKTQQIGQKEIFKIPFHEITDSVGNQSQYNAWIEQSSSKDVYTIESKRSRSILLNFVPRIYGHVYRACLCIQQIESSSQSNNNGGKQVGNGKKNGTSRPSQNSNEVTPSVWRCALRGWAGPNPIETPTKNEDKSDIETDAKGDTSNSVEQRLQKSNMKFSNIQRDFIAENMELLRTANSSKIKGARLTNKMQNI